MHSLQSKAASLQPRRQRKIRNLGPCPHVSVTNSIWKTDMRKYVWRELAFQLLPRIRNFPFLVVHLS